MYPRVNSPSGIVLQHLGINTCSVKGHCFVCFYSDKHWTQTINISMYINLSIKVTSEHSQMPLCIICYAASHQTLKVQCSSRSLHQGIFHFSYQTDDSAMLIVFCCIFNNTELNYLSPEVSSVRWGAKYIIEYWMNSQYNISLWITNNIGYCCFWWLLLLFSPVV